MSVGFRKSLFGFNSDDVMNYIQKTHSEYAAKEVVLNEKISKLNDDLKAAKEETLNVISERDKIALELKEYTDKYEEIERLSESIGKLYLVAQTNAKSIMDNSLANKQIADNEVLRNITGIDNAHNSLEDLKKELLKRSEEFVAEVENLMNELTKAKAKISDNDDDSAQKSAEFNAVVSESGRN